MWSKIIETILVKSGALIPRQMFINILINKLKKEVKRTDNIIDDQIVEVIYRTFYIAPEDVELQKEVAAELSKIAAKLRKRIKSI